MVVTHTNKPVYILSLNFGNPLTIMHASNDLAVLTFFL